MAKADYQRMYENIFDNPDGEDEQYFAKAGRPIRALRLYNFVTDHAEIRDSHKQGLYEEIIRPMRGEYGYWIQLLGYASKIGDPGYNRNLSLLRCNEVKRYILTGPNQLHVAEFRNSIGQGADLSQDAATDDFGYWRSVKVFVHKGTPPPAPKPVPVPIPPSTFTQHFQIKLLGGQSISLWKVLGRDSYFLNIRDKDRNQSKCFVYRATSVGTPGPLPFSFSSDGPFKDITIVSQQPVTLHDFNGLLVGLGQAPGTSMGSDSVGGQFVLDISMIGNGGSTKKLAKIDPHPVILESSSGIGISPGITASMGRLEEIPCPPEPLGA